MKKISKNFTCKPIKNRKTIEKIFLIAEIKNQRLLCMIKLQLNLGLRISDIVKLKVSDFENDHVYIKEKKTDKYNRIKINDELKKFIQEYIYRNELKLSDYLLQSRKGENQHITTRQANRDLEYIKEKLKLEYFSSHSLRKTFGYFAYMQSKGNLPLLMKRFNHSSQAMTLRYIGIEQEQLDDLAELVSF